MLTLRPRTALAVGKIFAGASGWTVSGANRPEPGCVGVVVLNDGANAIFLYNFTLILLTLKSRCIFAKGNTPNW